MSKKTFTKLFFILSSSLMLIAVLCNKNKLIVQSCLITVNLMSIAVIFRLHERFIVDESQSKLRKQHAKQKKTVDALFSLFDRETENEEDKNTGNSIMNQIDLDEIRERASEKIVIPGKGITCMIPNKYSREYTDYYLNQLADFFGFDFFKNRKKEVLSSLKPNQRFKPYREYLKPYEHTHMQYIEDTAYGYCDHCGDKEASIHRFEDMMFFDSLILNTKKSLDDFGFIVDKEKKNQFGNELRYEFVCFYDEYNSMFDHLNGITFKELENAEYYYNAYPTEYDLAVESIMSWFDSDVDRIFATDKSVDYRRERHIEKLKKLYYKDNIWRFKDNNQFQLSEIQYTKYLDKEASIFQLYIWCEAQALIRSYDPNSILKDMLNHPERFQQRLQEEKKKIVQKRAQPKTQQELDEEIMYMKRRWYRRMRHDHNINKKE